MEECMNDNNVCARLRLVSMCVFPKAVSDNVRVLKSVVQDARLDKQQRRWNQCNTTGKRSPPGDYGESRSVWSEDRQDVPRMHGQWFQKKQREESRNRNRNKN